MIRDSINPSAHVSAQLSAFIESKVNDSDIEQPITLEQIKCFMLNLSANPISENEHMNLSDDFKSTLEELDVLINEYGEDALAVDFTQILASEGLSRVIEAVMNDDNRVNPPTLGAVREAMTQGLLTKLVGDGVLEDDEDDFLLAEIESLIEHKGADALAELFLCYE